MTSVERLEWIVKSACQFHFRANMHHMHAYLVQISKSPLLCLEKWLQSLRLIFQHQAVSFIQHLFLDKFVIYCGSAKIEAIWKEGGKNFHFEHFVRSRAK